MFSVTTWNVNGIRARQRELLDWLEQRQPDVVCLQEIKASPEHVPESLRAHPAYWGYYHGHKGYSGVALLFAQRTFPKRPVCFHPAFDHETRIACVELEGLTIASVYVPNGNKNFPAKVQFLEALAAWAKALREMGTQLLLCGDLNVAREPRDVHPKLQKPDQIGQTPQERALLEQIIAHDLVDLSRKFQPDDDRLFTWWAPWRNLRERNIGWRLDYLLTSSALAERALSCETLRLFGSSDHGPVHATFDIPPPAARATHEDEAQAPTAPQPGGQLPLFHA
jgi:exodeoxyribonuclease-3